MLAMVALCLSIALPGGADPNNEASPPLEASPELPAELLAALSDDDFEVRESATETLLRDDSQSAARLSRWAQQTQDPEVRWRLAWAASHHYARRQIAQLGPARRGAVGISHRALPPSAELGRPGVLISSVLPGFDAMGKLRPGDIIVALDGQPVPDSRDPQGLDAFSQRVQLKPAGSTLEMSVLREGRPIQVCIKLANAAALEAPLQDVIPPEAPQPAQLQPLRR